MAIPAPEYREQLLAQGCEEGLADTVLALVEAASDDAEAQVIMKVGERITHSEQQLAEHTAQNAQQFRDSDSAIRESARDVTEQLNQRTAELKLETAQILQSAAEARAENERRLAEIDQRVAKLDERTAETNKRVAKLDERAAETNARMAKLEERLADTRVEIERRLGEAQVALTDQLNALKVEHAKTLAEQETKNEQRFGKIRDLQLQLTIGIATLIIAAAAAVIAAVAFLT